VHPCEPERAAAAGVPGRGAGLRRLPQCATFPRTAPGARYAARTADAADAAIMETGTNQQRESGA
jgi:hypothetical protein